MFFLGSCYGLLGVLLQCLGGCCGVLDCHSVWVVTRVFWNVCRCLRCSGWLLGCLG